MAFLKTFPDDIKLLKVGKNVGFFFRMGAILKFDFQERKNKRNRKKRTSTFFQKEIILSARKGQSNNYIFHKKWDKNK